MAVSYLAKVYRERAEACFTLAKAATDPSSSSALEKLGREMIEAAEAVEPTTKQMPSGPVAAHQRSHDTDGSASVRRAGSPA
jgi:hypothetical protein